MGLDNLVNDAKAQKGNVSTDAEPEDIGLNGHDWGYLLAHEPWLAEHLAYSDENGPSEIRVILDIMDDLVENGHPAFKMTSEQREDVGYYREEVAEYAWD